MRRMEIKHPAGYALLTRPTKPASRFSSPVRRRVAQAGQGILTTTRRIAACCRGDSPSGYVVANNAGDRAAAANRGGISLITFFGRTKKVIGMRGRPREFDFGLLWPRHNLKVSHQRDYIKLNHPHKLLV